MSSRLSWLAYGYPELRIALLLATRDGGSPPRADWQRPRRSRATRWLAGGSRTATDTLDSGLSVRRFWPRRGGGCRPGATLLWIHGDAVWGGQAELDDALSQRFADTLGIAVAAVDYRYQAGQPHSSALSDCYEAFEWLTGQPGVDPTRIAVGGAGVGAGLAAALAALARDRRTIPPAFQLLVHPMLGERAGALSGADLRGLAPAWIGGGAQDPLFLEGQEHAFRLVESEVSCTLCVVPAAFHGFDRAAPRSAVARSFFAAQCRAVARALT